MSLQQAIHTNIKDNPIQRLESLVLGRQRGKWFRRIMYLATFIIAFIPVLWGFGKRFYDSVNFTLSLLVILNVVVFLLVVIRSVSHGSDVMYRERRNRTWELLMLTGVSNWRVVLGKWLGIMNNLRQDYLWLFLVRAVTFVWASVSFNLPEDFTYRELSPRYFSDVTSYVQLFDMRLDLTPLLITLGLIVILTILEAMLSSAIGLSVAFFKFKAKTASIVAVTVRIGLAIMIPLLTYFAFSTTDGGRHFYLIDGKWDYNYVSAPPQHHQANIGIIAVRTSTIFADNGIIGLLAYANESNYDEIKFSNSANAYNLANIIGMLMYLGGTALALGIAANRAFVRGLDFSNEAVPKAKRKRPEQATAIVTPKEVEPLTSTPIIETGQANVFKFTDADTKQVEIYHYQRRLGRMILRVSGDGQPKYVQLSNVAYVEAPAFWKGANFNTATDSEYQAFIADKGIYVNQLVDASIRLYISDGKSIVRIVAGAAQVLDYLPENL